MIRLYGYSFAEVCNAPPEVVPLTVGMATDVVDLGQIWIYSQGFRTICNAICGAYNSYLLFGSGLWSLCFQVAAKNKGQHHRGHCPEQQFLSCVCKYSIYNTYRGGGKRAIAYHLADIGWMHSATRLYSKNTHQLVYIKILFFRLPRFP